jgi:FG-GAP-like repeat
VGSSRDRFELSSELVMPGEGCFPITITDSDMNKDGRLDLVIGGFMLQDSGALRRFVYIAYGQEDSSFVLDSPMLIGWEEPTLLDISIAVADVDGNGWDDVLATYRSDVRDGTSSETSGWPTEETFSILSQTSPGAFYDQEAAWAGRSGPIYIELIDLCESSMQVLLHVPNSGLWLVEVISGSIRRICPIP